MADETSDGALFGAEQQPPETPYWDEDNRHVFGADELNPDGAYVAIQIKAGIVTVREGTGHDAQKAGRMAGGKPDAIMPALMHLLCKLNGNQMPPEDWLDLKLGDFSRVQNELNQQVEGGN